MLKTLLVALTCSAATATVVLTYVGRTVHSAPFQIDTPYGSAVKTTIDPANIWSWHHDFTGAGPITANVLVDFDGNNQMDTQNPWVRVMITDIELVWPSNYGVGGVAQASISDSQGERFAISVAGGQNPSAAHYALTTPIVLPVGSGLSVTVNFGGTRVHLIGRVVSL